MPYVTKERSVTEEREQFLGYDEIGSIRPQLCYFEFTGLRPSTPHWFFFDGVEVTKFINTSYTFTDYNDNDRNSTLRNPGDAYLNATAFPDQLGGPTASSGPINSDATGKLEGMFYIQSNATTSFPTGTRILNVIDVSVLNKENSLSFAAAEYKAVGEYELYYKYDYTYTETYEEWQDDPPPATKPASNGSSNNNDDNEAPTPLYSYRSGNTWYNAYTEEKAAEYAGAAKKDPNAVELIDVNNITKGDVSGNPYKPMSHSSNDNNEDKGNDDISVLCNYIHRLGYLDKDILMLDNQFGDIVEREDPTLLEGYHAWAKPMIEWMDRGSLLSKIYLHAWVIPFTRSWAQHIAHKMEPETHRDNLIGRFMYNAGVPISRFIGNRLRNSKVKV